MSASIDLLQAHLLSLKHQSRHRRALLLSISLHPSISEGPADDDIKQKAQKIYNNADEELDQSAAAAWLGDAGPERELVRVAFMELFDFAHLNILASLRTLCARIVL